MQAVVAPRFPHAVLDPDPTRENEPIVEGLKAGRFSNSNRAVVALVGEPT